VRRQFVREQLVETFHTDLQDRYERERLESMEEITTDGLLRGISQDDIAVMRAFFRDILYPTLDEREQRDRNLDTIGRMLGNPGTVVSMLPSLPALALKHGPLIPAAIRTGRQIVQTYGLANELEDEMVENAMELCRQRGVTREDWDEIGYDVYRHAYRGVPREKSRELVRRGEEIVRAGIDRDLDTAMAQVLERLRETVSSRQQTAAIDYVLSVIGRAEGIADRFTEDELERVIRIVDVVERRYDSSMRNDGG